MDIRLSSPKYKKKMYSLWQECFGDDNETIDMFFKNSFSYENAVICTEGQEVVSQLFLLPEKLSIAGKGYSAYYIYAAATAKKYRKRGIMGSVLKFAASLAADRKSDYLFLVPATEHLFDYYEKFGFYKAVYAEKTVLKLIGGEPLDIKGAAPSDIKKAALKREELLKNVNRVVWRENEIKLFSDFLGDDGKIVFGDDFYVSYSPAENGVFVTELLCGGTYENALDVLKKTGENTFFVSVPEEKAAELKNCKRTAVGMIKNIKGEKIEDSVYIGITLN
ncbi:MAG: GNAT family N-acetyltransferase [Ruminococcus sp.]|nr:GNAT family N-acetyltransferase [Ruminococcus sp.]MDY3896342.1 GNAT family N-acetyltransferase [Candidatus Fimenecus sp.]